MDDKLKKEVLNKINEIYPKLSKDDSIVLQGSRAKGYALENSDIDILIFTRKSAYFKKMSIQKDFRKGDEEAGFETRLGNNLLLEVKIINFKIPTFNVLFYHDILTAKPLTSTKKFKKFQENIKKEFLKHYEDLLLETCVLFFDEFKNLEGILQRDDELSKINLTIKRALVSRALLRLILVVEKQPYCFDKYLAQEVAKTKHWLEAVDFIKKINDIKTAEQFVQLRLEFRNYFSLRMPGKDYPRNWWKYLKKVKGI